MSKPDIEGDATLAVGTVEYAREKPIEHCFGGKLYGDEQLAVWISDEEDGVTSPAQNQLS